MKASLVIDYHLNNAIFNVNDKNINRDNYAYSIWLLKEELKSSGIDLSTCDINCPEVSDVILYFDLSNDAVNKAKSSYLFLFESEVIKPKSWDVKNHKEFKKIFTWNDNFVDNKKYFKINFAHKFPENKEEYLDSFNLFDDKKLCTLIAGNKKVDHELELYSERVKTIKWFEKNAPNEFDLYGIGWGQYTSSNRYVRYLLNKLPFISKIIVSNYLSYKGMVESKQLTLSDYKFAICYENAQLIPGYITEKIFDCFFAGCVPIYWGAPNIREHIPANCFIDRRNFNSHEDLYTFISNISEQEYSAMQVNIQNYLFSKKADPYRAETFAKTILEHILDD